MTWLLLLWVVGFLFVWSLCWAAREDERDREAFTKARREAERIRSALDGGSK